jgi:hypothetical protein
MERECPDCHGSRQVVVWSTFLDRVDEMVIPCRHCGESDPDEAEGAEEQKAAGDEP